MVDFSKAPEGAEYSYKGNWYKIVNCKLFTHKEKRLHGSFNGEYHWVLLSM